MKFCYTSLEIQEIRKKGRFNHKWIFHSRPVHTFFTKYAGIPSNYS